MQGDKQVANIATERWKTKENRKRVVKRVVEVLIKHGTLNDESSLSKLVQFVESFEEKVNASAKTEAEYISLVAAMLKSIRAQTLKTDEAKNLLTNRSAEAKNWLTNPSAEAKNLPANPSDETKNRLTNPSAEAKIMHTNPSAEDKNLLPNPSAEAENRLTNPSASGTDTSGDVQERVYQRLQFLKNKYYPLLHAAHLKLCKALQAESSRVLDSRELGKCTYHRRAIEDLFSLFEVSKSQITADIKERASKADHYMQFFLKISMQSKKQQSPDVQSKQLSRLSQSNNTSIQDNRVTMPIGSSQHGMINQPSIVKGPGIAVQQQTNISLHGSGVSNNAPRISATEAFDTHTNTQRISTLVEESNNQNQVSRKPTIGSEELSPAMQRLMNVMTRISPEALSAAVGDIEKVVRLNDEIPGVKLLNEMPEMVDELGLPTFIIPEGRKKRRSFVTTTFDTPSNCASMCSSFNQFTEATESDLNPLTTKRKFPQTVENHNVLAEIKDINNRLFDSEVVIAEKEQSGGLLVKIMYNAVTINQNLVSHFTNDKKSLIKPLRLLIPTSYPSSSVVILDELPLKVSEDLRALFERAKGKLRVNLQCMIQPWLVKDIAKAWERCAREAILEYAHVNGGGTFTSMHGSWETCR